MSEIDPKSIRNPDNLSEEQLQAAADRFAAYDQQFEAEAAACDTNEVQDQLYPLLPLPAMEETTYLKPDGKVQVILTGVRDPVEAISIMHPEIAAAAKRLGIDLKGRPGRELEEMRKYFGQGSGLYMVAVDFQTARTDAHKLNVAAQRKIAKVLKPKVKPKKRLAKKPVKKLAHKAKK